MGRRPETGRTGARFGAPARRARGRHEPDARSDLPADAARSQPAAGAEPHGAATTTAGAPTPDAGVGLTGARFGGRARRPRREDRSGTERDGDDGPTRDDGHHDRPTVELPRVGAARDVNTQDDPAATSVRVAPRPYVITGGRTKVRTELRIETMISALVPPDGEAGERYTVLALCERPRSVSEVAALTGVPLGVARVLIDDLATEGRVRVHLGVDGASGPDMELLDRVLSGLRRL